MRFRETGAAMQLLRTRHRMLLSFHLCVRRHSYVKQLSITLPCSRVLSLSLSATAKHSFPPSPFGFFSFSLFVSLIHTSYILSFLKKERNGIVSAVVFCSVQTCVSDVQDANYCSRIYSMTPLSPLGLRTFVFK